jgi:hypothetical protein
MHICVVGDLAYRKNCHFFCHPRACVRSAPGSSFGAAYRLLEQGAYVPTCVHFVYSDGLYKQAIFFSFDCLHPFNVVDYTAKFPNSTLISIVKCVVAFSNARASSDIRQSARYCSVFAGIPRNSGTL